MGSEDTAADTTTADTTAAETTTGTTTDASTDAYKLLQALCSCFCNLLTQLTPPHPNAFTDFPTSTLLPLTIAITNSSLLQSRKRTLLSRLFASLHNLLYSLPSSAASSITSNACSNSTLLSNILRHALPTSAATKTPTSNDELTDWISRLITLFLTADGASFDQIWSHTTSRDPMNNIIPTGESYVFLQIYAGHLDSLLLSKGYDHTSHPHENSSRVTSLCSILPLLPSSSVLSTSSHSVIIDILGTLISFSPLFPPLIPSPILSSTLKKLNTASNDLKLIYLKFISNVLSDVNAVRSLTRSEIYSILNSTDGGVLGVREYVVLAVKNLCRVKEKGDIVEELRVQATVENEFMEKAGVEAVMEGEKIQIRRKG
ncbi:hypothetical protein TrVE_jg6708 [Triparma verrucosa]|uniref:Uncharacterized protein n=1 Tax=Triparma verrucosa TaxID=1606542 RepID=A0A9W7CEN5_9STRA|nr:hypothetical protein TrVE_jg6708 [Triparma verrucosa]